MNKDKVMDYKWPIVTGDALLKTFMDLKQEFKNQESEKLLMLAIGKYIKNKKSFNENKKLKLDHKSHQTMDLPNIIKSLNILNNAYKNLLILMCFSILSPNSQIS